jgi:TolB-like protein/Tfp pilus assembly protein PilF
MLGVEGSALREPEALAPEQAALVRQHLESVLTSHAFAGRKRTQDFLRLIVEHALEGEISSLRERMIGAEMFGRPVGYDTGNDSIVRVRANEVRKKLAQYYSELKGEKPAVRIELASGSYVPRFIFEPLAATAVSQNGAVSSGLKEQHPANSDVSAGSPVSVHKPPRVLRFAVSAALALFLLAAVAFVIFNRWRGNANAQSDLHSIAILPLANLSGDPQQDYFADGITEELINDLGQVSTLRVISLTSSLSYKGTRKNLPEIARELNVQGVVEGGVLRDGNQVRISVQLIDVRKDRPVWAHTYFRDLTSVLAWQGEVARAIADEISVDVTPQEQARLARKPTIDPEAQDLYLHGILLRDENDCKSAITYFNRAIEAAPGYAQAHSALATCYGLLGESGRMTYAAALTQQKAEALKAIELDDSLSEAHAELANNAMTRDWDWQTAAAEFRSALELNPNSATNHEKYAFYLVRTGHPQEAVAEIERSVDLDPISGSTLHAEGFIYYFVRQYDRALAVTRTVHGLRINLPDWGFLTGDIYAEKSRYPESIAAFLKSGDDPYSLGHLGNVYARAGQKSAAMQSIARLQGHVQKDGVGRYEIALVYAGLGDKKNAFQWLEDAYRAHDVGLVYLKVDPCLDPLRRDPRFDSLLGRVGLAAVPAADKKF